MNAKAEPATDPDEYIRRIVADAPLLTATQTRSLTAIFATTQAPARQAPTRRAA